MSELVVALLFHEARRRTVGRAFQAELSLKLSKTMERDVKQCQAALNHLLQAPTLRGAGRHSDESL